MPAEVEAKMSPAPEPVNVWSAAVATMVLLTAAAVAASRGWRAHQQLCAATTIVGQLEAPQARHYRQI